MLEVKGELVFKTVAYHRAADAIAHSPVEVARRLPGGQRRRASPASARRSATRWPSSSRPGAALLRAAPRPRCRPASSSCSRPRVGPQDGPAPPRGAGDRDPRGAPRGRRGRPAPDGQGPVREDGGARSSTGSPRSTTARPAAPGPGRGDRRRPRRDSATSRASTRSSRPARSAGGARRSATSTCWPRPTEPAALIERFTGARPRSTGSSTAAATRPRSGCSAGRRST